MKTNNKETFFESEEVRDKINLALSNKARSTIAITIPIKGRDSVILEDGDEIRIVICYGNYAIYLGESGNYHWTAPIDTLVAEKTYDVDITWLDDGEFTFDEIVELMESLV
jgi:hypothetical protein